MYRRKFLFVTLAASLLPLLSVHAAEGTVIDAPTAWSRMQAGELVLIDIRRPDEWQDTGIAKGAETISIHDPGGPQAFLRKILSSVSGDRSVPVGLICATGIRSTFASRLLESNGFGAVYNIKEGMLGRPRSPGWIKRGLPVIPCPDCDYQ